MTEGRMIREEQETKGGRLYHYAWSNNSDIVVCCVSGGGHPCLFYKGFTKEEPTTIEQFRTLPSWTLQCEGPKAQEMFESALEEMGVWT